MIKMYCGSCKYITKILTLSLICLVVAGCGADEDDNTQPALEAIADRTIDVGDETRVDINITDADFDDTHTVRASSDDTAIATVSLTDTTLTVKGIADGMATITINVTDDSGQENAAATPIVFQVTVDANVQPIVETIADRTIDVGDETSVEINISDVDVDDTHAISASSDDTAIATVSVTDTTLTVKGIADGMTTITVNVTDDSRQENAAATPLTFRVTVNEPYTPFEGLIVAPGAVIFRAGNIHLQAGNCIFLDGATFNNVTYDTHSFKWQRREHDKAPWIDIPGTEETRGVCGFRPQRPGQYRAVWEVSINGVRKRYASANILEL